MMGMGMKRMVKFLMDTQLVHITEEGKEAEMCEEMRRYRQVFQ